MERLCIVTKILVIAAALAAQVDAQEYVSFLDQHNVYRCMHDAPAMSWDATLASQAQAWADQIKADSPTQCQGSHSSSDLRNGAVRVLWLISNLLGVEAPVVYWVTEAVVWSAGREHGLGLDTRLLLG